MEEYHCYVETISQTFFCTMRFLYDTKNGIRNRKGISSAQQDDLVLTKKPTFLLRILTL